MDGESLVDRGTTHERRFRKLAHSFAKTASCQGSRMKIWDRRVVALNLIDKKIKSIIDIADFRVRE